MAANSPRRIANYGRAADIEPLLRRGRLLLLQGAVSTLADRLGAAILQRAEHATHGDALRTAVDRIRIGAITDTDGNITRLAYGRE